MGLYRSLVQIPGNRGVSEAPVLCGFELGNRAVTGCLSNNESSRIHSCEPGVSCPAARGANVVYIVPIVNRTTGGAEIPEVGAGGGIGDLYQTHEGEISLKNLVTALSHGPSDTSSRSSQPDLPNTIVSSTMFSFGRLL